METCHKMKLDPDNDLGGFVTKTCITSYQHDNIISYHFLPTNMQVDTNQFALWGGFINRQGTVHSVNVILKIGTNIDIIVVKCTKTKKVL